MISWARDITLRERDMKPWARDIALISLDMIIISKDMAFVSKTPRYISLDIILFKDKLCLKNCQLFVNNRAINIKTIIVFFYFYSE